jgi:PAS domain S-box-containing protein
MGQNLRLLHVEDNESDALLLRHMLSKEGFVLEYRRVETAGEFTAALRDASWDLVISDYSLPSFSGAAALKIFREYGQDVPFILISGTVGEDIAVSMMKSGAHDYVMKDHVKRLVPAIHRELQEAEVRRQRRAAEAALLLTQFSVDRASLAVTWSDARGNLVYLNDLARGLLAYGRNGSDRRKIWECIPAITSEGWEATWRDVKTAGVGLFETYIDGPDGARRFLEITLNHVEYQSKELVISYIRDITEKKRAQEQILLSLKEKEIMLREIHHRVKNNLQIVSSLLSLQAPSLTDPRAIDLFRESQNRIRSMSLVHEHLYQSDSLAKVDFREYLTSVTADLVRMYSVRGVSTVMEADAVHLEIDTAVPVGLIANELLSNALKHAFKNRAQGRIEIGLHRLSEEEVEFSVTDNGIGFPPEFDLQSCESMGMHLIDGLTKQIDGTLSIVRNDGTRFGITFKA